jgi:hypothetical protein
MAIDPKAVKVAGEKAHELVQQYGEQGPSTPEGRAQAIADVLAAYDQAGVKEESDLV